MFDVNCNNEKLYIFHLGCLRWVKASSISTPFTLNGRSSHITLLVEDKLMLIIGGFPGAISNHVIAYKVPSTISSSIDKSSSEYSIILSNGSRIYSYCLLHSEYSCLDDLNCAHCNKPNLASRSASTLCLSRSKIDIYNKLNLCAASWQPPMCSSPCNDFQSCQTCNIFGRGKCYWCISSKTCVENDVRCTNFTGLARNFSSYIKDVDKCIAQDIQVGLTITRHYRRYTNNSKFYYNFSIVDDLFFIPQAITTWEINDDLKKNPAIQLRAQFYPYQISLRDREFKFRFGSYYQSCNLTMGNTSDPLNSVI